MTEIKGWYFAATDRKLRYKDGRVAEVGVTHSIDGAPRCCERGLHSSVRALDALRYCAGPVVFRVTSWGEIDTMNDKIAAQHRRYDAGGVDVTRTLVEFAAHVATAAMLLTEHHDERSWTAIEAVWAWLRGDVGEDELRSAAAYASYAAAANATYAAAANATYANAYTAAAYAVNAADYAAAYAAAAYDESNALLEQMLDEAMGEGK